MDTVGSNVFPELQCIVCNKTFAKKSSLVRHFKICTSPYSKPRKKSCDSCASSKSKCDLQRPSCGRCSERKALCTYKPFQRDTDSQADFNYVDGYVNSAYTTPMDINAVNSPAAKETLSSAVHKDFPASPHPLNPSSNNSSFASLMELFSEDNEIRSLVDTHSVLGNDAWRQTAVSPQKTQSPFGQQSMEFSFWILRTWPRMMASHLQFPPLFHHTQLMKDRMATPLAHCYTLTKMWHGQCEKSTGLVRDTVVREMMHLFQNYRKFDEVDLVATLQAMAIYMIILLFPTHEDTSLSVVDMAILANLQKFVNYVGSVGLVIQEEIEHVQPSWEAWIKITSRRRAVFTLYLVHWSVSVYHGLPSFDCQELKHMPAPASKLLWQAKDREEWESHYNRWLVEWEQCEYLHGEVAGIKSGISLDARSEKWLGETDELGMLLMALREKVEMDRARTGPLIGLATTCN